MGRKAKVTPSVITSAMAQTRGNVQQMAKLLGVRRATVHDAIVRYELRAELESARADAHERLFVVRCGAAPGDDAVAMREAEQRLTAAQADKGALLTTDEALAILQAGFPGWRCAGYLLWAVQS